jgi:hypothetical protein
MPAPTLANAGIVALGRGERIGPDQLTLPTVE